MMATSIHEEGTIYGYYPPEAEGTLLDILRQSKRAAVHINISAPVVAAGTPVRGARGALLGTIPWVYTGAETWQTVRVQG